MSTIADIFNNAGNNRYLALITISIILFCVLCAFYSIARKRKNNNFAQQHPEASLMYVDCYTNKPMSALRINNSKAPLFTSGTKFGFYLLPGENTIDTGMGHDPISVFVVSNKTYRLSISSSDAPPIFKEVLLPLNPAPKENPPQTEIGYAKIHNQIMIDSINDKALELFHWKYSEEKKGLLAGKAEILYLLPGTYKILAHGKTYQTAPAYIEIMVDADTCYELGATNDGLYFMDLTI